MSLYNILKLQFKLRFQHRNCRFIPIITFFNFFFWGHLCWSHSLMKSVKYSKLQNVYAIYRISIYVYLYTIKHKCIKMSNKTMEHTHRVNLLFIKIVIRMNQKKYFWLNQILFSIWKKAFIQLRFIERSNQGLSCNTSSSSKDHVNMLVKIVFF